MLEETLVRENSNKKWFSFLLIEILHYLCSDDTLHPTAQATAMAQKHIRLCAYLLQQQSVEARLLLAHARGVCVVLSDFEFHLLLQ